MGKSSPNLKELYTNFKTNLTIYLAAMELEMYLNGKFIDAIRITTSQLSNIHELQHQMERKYCHELEYADGQPQFFISGFPSDQDEEGQADEQIHR